MTSLEFRIYFVIDCSMEKITGLLRQQLRLIMICLFYFISIKGLWTFLILLGCYSHLAFVLTYHVD